MTLIVGIATFALGFYLGRTNPGMFDNFHQKINDFLDE